MSIEFAAPAALVKATLFGEFRVRRCARNKPGFRLMDFCGYAVGGSGTFRHGGQGGTRFSLRD